MKSFEEKLELFKNKLKDIYKEDYLRIFNTHLSNRNKTFRINRLTTTNKDKVLNSILLQGIKFVEANIDNFFIVKEGSDLLSKTPEFNNNLIYIQELSSALPVLEIAPVKGERILDLCASPGSKTSLIQNITLNESHVVSVEKNRNRFFKLKDNLKNNGVKNVEVLNVDANRLPFIKPDYINYFDKVIVDVPCTTESKINLNDLTSLKEWKLSNAKDISKLQKGLLNSAFKMLKINGTLIYSTCTYSTEENEEVVNWFLKKNVNAKLLDMNLKLDNFRSGLVMVKDKELNKEINKTTRVVPTNEYTAFYMAKFKKLSPINDNADVMV